MDLSIKCFVIQIDLLLIVVEFVKYTAVKISTSLELFYIPCYQLGLYFV